MREDNAEDRIDDSRLRHCWGAASWSARFFTPAADFLSFADTPPTLLLSAFEEFFFKEDSADRIDDSRLRERHSWRGGASRSARFFTPAADLLPPDLP